MTSSMRRQFKNVVKNFTDAQVKVREATSNDPWGPSSTIMAEIADLTYNVMAFPDIMTMIWKRLNDHGKNWRHVYKALVVLDYIIKTGTEKVAQQCKENIFAIQTLKDFQYVEEGKDHGMNVREKAKQLINLLKDDERLRNERTKAMKAKERLAQNPVGIGSAGQVTMAQQRRSPAMSPSDSFSTSYNGDLRSPQSALPVELEQARPSTHGEEELQLQLALAMSKEEYDEDSKRKKADELKLQMALEESRKENKNEGQSEGSLLDVGASPGMASSSSLGQLADPWGGGHAAAASSRPAADPWGGSSGSSVLPQLGTPPRGRHQPSVDPWGAGGSATDPWGSSPAPMPQQEQAPPSYSAWSEGQGAAAQQPLGTKNDPWGVTPPRPASAATTTANGSPWEPFPTNGHSAQPAAPVTLDDEFDLLSSRKSPQTVSKSGDLSADPWDLGGLGEAMPSSSTYAEDPQKPKDAKQFLGNHADLVNLDQLVSKPAGTTNPFAMTTSQTTPNPFNNAGGPQKSVPLNQIPMSSSMGFGQAAAGGGILAAPLVQPANPGMGYNAQAPMQAAPGAGGAYPPPAYQGYQTNQTYGQPMGYNPFM